MRLCPSVCNHTYHCPGYIQSIRCHLADDDWGNFETRAYPRHILAQGAAVPICLLFIRLPQSPGQSNTEGVQNVCCRCFTKQTAPCTHALLTCSQGQHLALWPCCMQAAARWHPACIPCLRMLQLARNNCMCLGTTAPVSTQQRQDLSMIE
jgi:hypothetical protein